MHSEEINKLRRKLKRARESGKLQDISDICCSLAAYLSDEEEHEEALNLYKESLVACETLNNKKGIALSNRMIAEECTSLGYFEDALKHVILFLKYAQDEGDKVEEQRGLVLKGHVYFTQAEYLMDTKPKETKVIEELLEKSMEAYRESFAICTNDLNDISERERLQMKARLLQNKSLVLSRQNKLDYAQAHLIRAIKICAKEKLNDTEHICYLSLGDLYNKKGEPQKALNVYDRVFQLAHSTPKKRDALVGKAKTYILMENYSQAKTVLKKAYKLRVDDEIKKLIKQVSSILRIEANLCTISETELIARKDLHKKLGDIYCSLKNYKKGIKSYLNMLGCAQKAGLNKNDLIKCYVLLCKAFTNDKQYDKALFYSHQEVESLSKWEPDRACKAFLRIGQLHELNDSDFEEIHFAYVKAKTIAQQFENQKLYIKCLKHLISVGNAFNKPDLIKESEEEIKNFKNEEQKLESSCESGNDSNSEVSTDSEGNDEQSSDTDIKELISDSDVENEEYDRPKERCKRTKFKIKRNEKGETDLHIAAIKGNYKRVKLLIDQGHPVNVRDTAGWTPLHEACNHGYADIVNLLLDFGADINDKGGPACEGTTPLHDAATNGQLPVLETLIKRGASTVVLNDSGQTPLQCLLAWKKKSALSEEEDLSFRNIVKSLKSPLDSEDIKRHLQGNKSLSTRNSDEPMLKKNFSDFLVSDMNDKKPGKTLKKTQKSSAVSEYKESIELLRRKRPTPEQDEKKNYSDNSEDEDSFNNINRSSLKKDKSSYDEYMEVTHMLKPKSKKFKRSCDKLKTKPALIDEREYVDNCIMDNDDDEEEEEVEEEEIQNVDKRSECLGEDEELDTPFDSREDLLENKRSTKKSRSSPVLSRKPSFELECQLKPWLKSIPIDLLEDSFELSLTPSKDSCSVTKSKTISSNEILSKKDSSITNDSGTSSNEVVYLNIKFMNDIVKISVKKSEIDKLKVNWLIQEVTKQHSVVGNSDYFITLRAEEIDISEATSLALILNKELELIVTKWKSLSLNLRYEKACTVILHKDITSEPQSYGFKHSPLPQVSEILKLSSSSRCLNLSNLKLSSLTLIPICKALKHEAFIQNLNLSNNYFGDKGIELIVKVFERCIIEELNLSGCNITLSGVYHFNDSLDKINELSKNGLEVLNLSFNPITDDAIEALNLIIDKLPNLRTLYIDHCEMETSVSTTNLSLRIIQGEKFEIPS